MRYLIIHGHFYQPPRESPFTNEIPRELSASPSRNWNERITKECYSPNAYSRILADGGRIIDMSNNYKYLSFNFGPTLLDYIAKTREDLLERIIEADKDSIERLGFGNAIAQVYNHIILPLAKKEDMKTQIKWGLYNFEKYFNRKSSGIWLAETAINADVVDCLVDCGVKFTILSPYQAQYIVGHHGTVDISDAKIDTSKPYWLYGRTGKKIAVFFYEPFISRAIAFEHLLTSADRFAERIRNSYNDRQLINIATDGESYGHHEPFADMCLAKYFSDNIHRDHIIPTNYEHYLSICPPQEEVILHLGEGGRGTSWSCSHGVERWRSNCGCGGWNGEDLSWRTPLREAFDILRNMQDEIFSNVLDINIDSRNSIREEYIKAIYNETDAKNLYEIVQKQISYRDFIFLMESYKYSLFAYTSCGWFFEDVSRLEPIKNMLYAKQSFNYAKLLKKYKKDSNFASIIENTYKSFLEKLEKSISNKEEHHNARYFLELEAKDEFYYKAYIVNNIAFTLLEKEKKEYKEYKIDNTLIKDIIIKNNIIEGTIVDDVDDDLYFIVESIRDNYELKNKIKLAYSRNELYDTTYYTLSFKDLPCHIRDEISDIIFKDDIKNLDDLNHKIYPEYEKLLHYYIANNITPDYDYRRVMGAILSPILRELIVEKGREAYDDVSKKLNSARNIGVFVSNSGISNLVGDNIKKSLLDLYQNCASEELYNMILDIKFLTKNDMPIDRNTYENIFYNILIKYKNEEISFNDNEKELFIELAHWLNFSI